MWNLVDDDVWAKLMHLRELLERPREKPVDEEQLSAPAFSYLGEHLDLYAEDQAGEVERLIAARRNGSPVDRKPADAVYVILAGLKGTWFSVIDTTR